MLLSDIPAWFAKRFGADAGGSYIRTVPATTADPAAASMSLGFPPQTFTDEGAGGTPPDGRDVNGILNFLSAWAQWMGAGGAVPYNAAISSAGGYPLGAVVLSGVTAGLSWENLADNNTTNPDAGGANWAPRATRAATAADLIAGANNILAATAKALNDAGFRRVISESLVVNGGYRTYATLNNVSVFKECWGRVTVPATSSLTVTVPVVHTDFIIPTIAADIENVAGANNQVGTAPVNLNSFILRNWSTASKTVNWATRGV